MKIFYITLIAIIITGCAKGQNSQVNLSSGMCEKIVETIDTTV